MHVDDFIDKPLPLQRFTSDEEREGVRYAKYVLHLMRSSASLFHDIEKFVPRLYCTRNGSRYRVVFAGRIGWVGLTTDFDKDTYDLSEDVSWCSNWGAEP